MHDPYELLGLRPGVGEAEIKRAFRQLAMRWHPDRNADPAAAERFNTLRGAYETLLARFAPPDADPMPASEADAQAQAARGADRWMEFELSFDEAFNGGLRKLAVRDEVPCSHCDGSGIETLAMSRLCAPCRGSGRLREAGKSVPCADCNGRGYRNTAACSVCDGRGREIGERWLEVRVPPGLIDGDFVQITEGLQSGEEVVTRGALFVDQMTAPLRR